MSSGMRAKFEKMTAGKENKFIYYDRKQAIEVELPRDGSVGPAVGYDGSRGFFSYEFKIPLSDTLYGLGAVPGPKLGQLAEEMYIAQLEGKLQRPDQAEQWVKRFRTPSGTHGRRTAPASVRAT